MSKASILPQKNSLPDVWVNWYDNLNAEVGRNNARFLWLRWWNEVRPKDANTVQLRNEMRNRGIYIEPETAFGKIADFGSNVSGGIVSAFRGLGLVVTITVIGGVLITGVVIYNLTKDPEMMKDIKGIAKAYASKGAIK